MARFILILENEQEVKAAKNMTTLSISTSNIKVVSNAVTMHECIHYKTEEMHGQIWGNGDWLTLKINPDRKDGSLI